MNIKRRYRMFMFLVFSIYFGTIMSMAEGIKDSESATHGTDAALYTIIDTYEFPGFSLVQIKLPTLSTFSYLLISGKDGLLVDPGRDISFFLETIKKQRVTLRGIYLTHSHADFVAGHMEVVKKLKCPIYQSAKSGAAYPIEPLNDGSIVTLGKISVKFIETPGHTPDGMCALVYGTKSKNDPVAVITGDVLFVGSVGRPDLIGGTTSAAWLASAMYDSWNNKLSKLPGSVKVFPAHGAGSLCGAHLSDDPYSTIDREKKTNPYLQYKNRNEFIAALLDGLPEAPQYFKHNAAMNKKGPPLVDWDADPEKVPATSDLSNPDSYFVVDVGEAKTYASGHIPKSVNISVRGRLETWVGIIVPFDANLILTGTDKEIKESLYRLHRVGYTAKVVSMDEWKKSNHPIATTAPLPPSELYQKMKQGTAPVIVDVRLPNEWMALRIGTVLNLPLNELSELSVQLDKNEPSVMVCNSAFRSSMAVGILERKGFTKAMSLEGGGQAWIDKGYPVYKGILKNAGHEAKAKPKKRVISTINLPERISSTDLKRLIMDLPNSFDLVDIRPEQLFSDYNIPGSRNVDVSEIMKDTSFLVNPGTLILVDRDGSISMAVGGILSQKTTRPIKVLFGGATAYWQNHDSNAVNTMTSPLNSSPNSPSFNPSDNEPSFKPDHGSDKEDGIEIEKKPKTSAGC